MFTCYLTKSRYKLGLEYPIFTEGYIRNSNIGYVILRNGAKSEFVFHIKNFLTV